MGDYPINPGGIMLIDMTSFKIGEIIDQEISP